MLLVCSIPWAVEGSWDLRLQMSVVEHGREGCCCHAMLLGLVVWDSLSWPQERAVVAGLSRQQLYCLPLFWPARRCTRARTLLSP
jgi:hypothetical protein